MLKLTSSSCLYKANGEYVCKSKSVAPAAATVSAPPPPPQQQPPAPEGFTVYEAEEVPMEGFTPEFALDQEQGGDVEVPPPETFDDILMPQSPEEGA